MTYGVSMEAYKDSVKKWLFAFYNYFSGYYLLIFAALFFVALLWGYGKSFEVELPGTVTLETEDQQLNSFGEVIGGYYKYELPNGETISIPEGGFESKFLEAFEDAENIGESYIFDRIYFQTGSTAINDNSTNQVDTVAAILKSYSDITVLLRGHTDSVGNEENNRKLSLERAQALKDQLVNRGISADRIKVSGFGADDPIGDNSTPKGRLINRRIDISLIN